MKIAVFVSGKGTNLAAILRAEKKGKLSGGRVTLVLSDKKNAPALSKAKRAGVKTVFIDPQRFVSRDDYEKEIITYLEASNIELIVLAGFMRLVGPQLVGVFKNRIMNIHPALLPGFKGSKAIEDALNYGVKVTGVTVHFVDEKMDHGPIIMQEPLKIKENESRDSLQGRIHKIEHKLYPEAIRLAVEGKLRVDQRSVEIIG